MGLDINKIAERLKQLNESRSGGGFGYIELKDRTVVRVLPAREGEDMFYTEAYVHYGVGKSTDNPKGSVIVCPTTHGDDKPCPVCKVVKEMYALSKKKDDQYAKEAGKLGRKKRVYMNAIDRSEDLSNFEKRDDGWYNKAEDKKQSPVKVLAAGITVLKQILGIIVDPEYGDITDTEQGLDLIIKKTGSGFNTNYDTTTVRKESPLGFEDWQECLHDLSTFTKVKSYADIESVLDGGDVQADKEEDDYIPDPEPPKGDSKGKDKEEDDDDLQAEIKAAMERRKNRGK
jgi:hypothetical protein